MAETGLRAGEVIAIQVADVDLQDGHVTVRRGNGGKGRVAPFGAQTAAAIDRYMRARRSHRLSAVSSLWLGGNGQTFSNTNETRPAMDHGCIPYRAGRHQVHQARAPVQERPPAKLPRAEAGPVPDWTPGPVESAVEAEISGLARAELRPGLVAIAAAIARVLDATPPTPKPAAAKVLAALLDKLHSASTRGRRGRLAVVRTMTEEGGA